MRVDASGKTRGDPETPKVAKRTLSLSFQDYSVGLDGLDAFPWPANRIDMNPVRKRFIYRAGNAYAQTTEASHRIAIKLLHAIWCTSVIKIAFAESILDSAKAEHSDLRGGERFPVGCALAAGETPPDEPYVTHLALGPSRYPLWRWPVRLVRQSFGRSSIRRVPPQFIDLRNGIVATSVGGLLETHARQTDDAVYFVDAGYWFAHRSEAAADAGSLSGLILDCATAAAAEAGVKLSPRAADWLRRQVRLSAAWAIQDWEASRRHPRPPGELWIGTSSDYWARLLAHETLLNGGSVTAHDHGTGSGLFCEGMLEAPIKGFCSRLVTFDDLNRRAIERHMADYGLPGETPPKVSCLERHTMPPASDATERSTLARDRTGPAVGPPRVLLVAWPLVGENVHFPPYPDDVPALDFTLRVAAVLLEAGYEVGLKPHPEFPFPSRQDLGALGSRLCLEEGRFEEVAEAYDHFVYCYATTSTIRWPIERGIRSVMFDLGELKWDSEVKSTYSTIFDFVGVSLPEDGRMEFDETAFLETMKNIARSPAGEREPHEILVTES